MDWTNFKPDEIDTTDKYDPVPAGDYKVIIDDADERQTKSGNGEFLRLELQIIDGPCKGRKIWENLNVVNPNAKAVEIAMRQLAMICQAIDTPKLSGPQDLQGKILIARVALVNGENKIRKYLSANGQNKSFVDSAKEKFDGKEIRPVEQKKQARDVCKSEDDIPF